MPTENRELEKIAQARVRAAKKIIGSRSDTQAIETAVWAMIGWQERRKHRADLFGKPVTADDKQAIDRVAKAAHRLAAALNDTKCPEFVRRLFPKSLELRKHVYALEHLAAKPLRKPRRSAGLKRRAAAEAAYLLQHHGIKLITTRGKTFDRLAAALYGESDASLFDHIRFYRDVKFD
jgi:hypothetical protein